MMSSPSLKDGALAVREWVKEPGTRIAMVAESWPVVNGMLRAFKDVLAEKEEFHQVHRTISLADQVKIHLFSSLDPDLMRGVQVHKAWMHEYIENPDYVAYSVRLGDNPEMIHTWDQNSSTFRLCTNVTLVRREGCRLEVRTNRNQSETLSDESVGRLKDWLGIHKAKTLGGAIGFCNHCDLEVSRCQCCNRCADQDFPCPHCGNTGETE